MKACFYRFALNYHQACQDLYRPALNSAIHWYGEASKAPQLALSAVKMQSTTNSSAFVEAE